MFTLNCKGQLLSLHKPLVMGIINCSPDSFYAGSRSESVDQALKMANQMLGEGAAFLDIGGQSTRPGSVKASAGEERDRVLPVIEAIIKEFPGALLSVDTYYAQVAHAAVQAGASLVNDISAGNMDSEMLKTVALLKVPYVAMHMQGTPQTMQQNPLYENVVADILDFFIQKTDECRKAGIHDIIIDPGFGFGKTIAHNFELLRHMDQLRVLDRPVMVGLSRKSTIYKTLGISAGEALNGTTVLHTAALQKGANILRVHDVKEAVEAVTLLEACKGKQDY